MPALNVNAFLDERRVGRLHLTVLIITTLLIAVDGFDAFMIGRIAPAIAAGFKAPAVAMTQVFVAQQFGLAIGAFCISPLSDRFGRKTVLVTCTLVYALLTLAALLTSTLGELAATRAVAGIFLGGIVPNASALITEYAPRARRSTFLSILYAGYSAGSASGALVAFLVADHGWQIGFWIGGLLPFVIAALFVLLVPESPRYLLRRNPEDPRLVRTLNRLDPTLDLSGPVVLEGGIEPTKGKIGGPAMLFTGGRYRITLLLWLTMLLNMGVIALVSSWLVTYFQELGGISMQRFAAAFTVSIFGSFLGTLTVGPIMDRFGNTRGIAAMALGLAACTVGLGLLPFGTVVFASALFLHGYFQSGGQAGLNALLGQSYPTAVRATGFGWAGTCGRLGGVLSPIIGGLALSHHFTLLQALLMVAAPSVGVAAVMMVLEQVRKRPELATDAA